MDTVPVAIIDQNKWAYSYTHLQVGKPYIASTQGHTSPLDSKN